MEPARELLHNVILDHGRVTLTLYCEDFSALYPGMARFELTVSSGGRVLDVFRTNTYEYSVPESITAETVALHKTAEWEDEIRKDPDAFLARHPGITPTQPAGMPQADAVIIQGSPRPDGNCATLATWAADAVNACGRTARVIYPHDLDIHGCIGCYQCYNTGTCIFDDDMTGIIDAVRGASLIVVCSPVYTNSVPGPLKTLIDRMQACHAERVLSGGRSGQAGLLFAVAGRKGEGNSTCVTRVVSAFFENLGIRPAGQILIDQTDVIRDIRAREGTDRQVNEMVKTCFR